MNKNANTCSWTGSFTREMVLLSKMVLSIICQLLVI